ncbi:MAG: hypothetical protein ACJAZS_000767, partial [Alteromonas naphthalenivorans]
LSHLVGVVVTITPLFFAKYCVFNVCVLKQKE